MRHLRCWKRLKRKTWYERSENRRKNAGTQSETRYIWEFIARETERVERAASYFRDTSTVSSHLVDMVDVIISISSVPIAKSLGN
jgi:hypothetical protein